MTVYRIISIVQESTTNQQSYITGCFQVGANHPDRTFHFVNASLQIRQYIPALTDMDIYGPFVARCDAERGQAPSIIVCERT